MARKTGSHAENTGPLIRAAALKLFARDGFAAVSMRRIAAEVGLHAGALYLYTPDKQALLSDLLENHMTELLEGWRSQVPPRDPLEALAAFTRFHLSHHRARSDAVFISYMELRNLTPENFARLESLRHEYEDALEAILTAGVKSGQFDVPDTRLATMALIAMLTGVNTWYREGGRLSQAEVERIYWRMVQGAVGADAVAGAG